LKEVSEKQLDHLQQCVHCREYYVSLNKIDDNIQSLSHQISSEEDQLILAFLKKGIRDRLERQNLGLFSGSRRFVAIAATFIILILLMFLPWIDSAKNGKSDVSKIFYLYSAEIERKPTSTVIYHSNIPEEPIIIWLYAKDGEK
jgi:hypothetical protein